jgi:hypothetical protein
VVERGGMELVEWIFSKNFSEKFFQEIFRQNLKIFSGATGFLFLTRPGKILKCSQKNFPREKIFKTIGRSKKLPVPVPRNRLG